MVSGYCYKGLARNQVPRDNGRHVKAEPLQTRTALRDDELVIETPERVELYYRRAHLGNRFLAAIVDHAIQFLTLGALAAFLYVFWFWVEAAWEALGDWAVGFGIMFGFLIYSGYFVFFETIWGGQTPGKRIFKLRVIREDGRPIRFYEALVRNVLRTGLDSMPVFVVPFYSVGIIAVFLSPRSKRIGDHVAGTVVVRESELRTPTLEEVSELARTSRWVGSVPFQVAPQALTSIELLALKSFLRRRYELPDEMRRAMGYRLAVTLAATLKIPHCALTPEQLLEEIDRQLQEALRTTDATDSHSGAAA